MKLIEYESGEVKVVAAEQGALNGEPGGVCDRAPPHFEVDFGLLVLDDAGPTELCHRISVSAAVVVPGALADRLRVEDEAEEHLPGLLRSVADELERALTTRGPRVRRV